MTTKTPTKRESVKHQRIASIVRISGAYGGSIWMPSVISAKDFEREYSAADRKRMDNPSLYEILLDIINDGDFKSCSIADATIVFERTTILNTGRNDNRSVTRSRSYDIRKFPSVADLVVELGSNRYWEILGCSSEEE